MKVKVVSYNIQHCGVYKSDLIDFDAFAETIKGFEADIIGLNEVRGQGKREDYEAQAKILAEKLGMNYYFAKAIEFDGENPYGNAILSKYPIVSAETIAIPDPEVRAYDGYYETRCVLKAIIDVGETEICVLVTHFGLNPDEAENAAATVMANIPEKKGILMGDFNVTPDSYVLKPIRGVLNDTADLFDEELLSWPSDIPERKIDYIFHTPDIKCLEGNIPAIETSDHRPHTATFDIN